MRVLERVSGTGCEMLYGLECRSDWLVFGGFQHLDAPVLMPAGSCVKVELEDEEAIVGVKVVMREGGWK